MVCGPAPRGPAGPPPIPVPVWASVRPPACCDFNLGEAMMRCIASLAETASERITEFRGYARGFNSNALNISGAR